MASGKTTTTELADSLPVIIGSGRIVREQKFGIQQLCDRKTLGEGIGITWNEVSYAKLTATAVNENSESNNPQALSDTLFSITPTIVQIETLITDRVKSRIAAVALAQFGALAQNAVERKKDIDGLVATQGFSISLAGAGQTMVSGFIAAGRYRISSNTTEPGNPPYQGVAHGFQIKDLFDELVAGVGVSNVNEGPTAETFKHGYKLPIADVNLFEDGNIAIDSSDDAIAAVFAKEALVIVQGRSPRSEVKREPGIGGGANRVFYYDEYAYGERSAGNWGAKITTDATAPTS